MSASHPARLPSLPLLVAVAALAGLVAGCGAGGDREGARSEAGSGEEARPALLVRTVQPELSRLDRTLEITAEVNPLHQAEVSPRIGGVPLLEVKADVGDRVREGQLLAVLEDTDLVQVVREQELALAEARIRVEEAELAKLELAAELAARETVLEQKLKAKERALAQGRTISEQARELAEYEYRTEVGQRRKLEVQLEKAEVARKLAAEAVSRIDLALTKARREVAYARVTAPFDGVVAQRLANPGQVAQQGQALFRMFDPGNLAVDAYVPQQALQDVRQGLRVAVRTDALPGRLLEGRVALVSPEVDRESGTLMVRLALDDVASLKPGLFVAGSIVLETRENALTIPRKCVAYERERPYVYRVVPAEGDAEGEAWRVKRLYFQEGLSGGERVEFVARTPEDALDVDDRIVIVGLDRLRDGDPVRLETDAGAKRAN